MMSSHSHTKREDTTKPLVAPRTGAASRQRIQPIDIPVTPKEVRSPSHIVPISPISPERSFSPGTSPIQMELENFLKHRQISSASPREPLLSTPPQSPKSPKFSLPTSTSVISTSYSTKSSYTESKQESRISTEDIRSKIKIAGLSSLQQRVLSLNSTLEENDYKSLTDFPVKLTRPLAKSHSFKNQKSPVEKPLVEVVEDLSDRRKSVTKASSLDSVKNLEEPLLKSELKLTLKPVQKPVEKEAEVEEIEVVIEKTHPEIISHSFKPKITSPQHKIADLEEKPKHKVSEVASTYSSTTVEEHSVNSTPEMTAIPKSFSANSITISGPSHTAIVNVTSKSEDFNKSSYTTENEVVDKDGSRKLIYKENQVSVTKIQLKHETTQVRNGE